MKDFSIKEVLNKGWKITKENAWFLIAIELGIYLLNFLGSRAGVGFLVSVITSFVIMGVFLRLSRGESVTFDNLFTGLSGNKFFHYFLVTIIVSVFILVGLVLLIIPGIIVAIMTSFTTYILLDQKDGLSWKGTAFWQAIKQSKKMTHGVKWQIFKFFVIVFLLNILGIIALGVGVLFTIPTTGIAMALVYEKIKNRFSAETASNLPESSPSIG